MDSGSRNPYSFKRVNASNFTLSLVILGMASIINFFVSSPEKRLGYTHLTGLFFLVYLWGTAVEILRLLIDLMNERGKK